MFAKMLERISEKSKILVEDVEAILHEKKQGSDKQPSRKSLEPITRLRKDSQELTEADETDPNIQFVKDKMKDIFGGK